MLSWLRWRGLRLKIIAWSFVPTAIALVAVGLVSFYAFQRTTRSLLIEVNRELTRLTAGQLAGDLQEYTDVLQDQISAPVFFNLNGADRQAILEGASNSLSVFDGGVVVTDERGVVIASEPERREILSQDWSSRAYFRQLIRSREPVFSQTVGDETGEGKVIVVAIPVLGPKDELLGMAAGMFRLGATQVSSFYGDILKLRIGGGDYAYLNSYIVDRNGLVIYHSNGERIGADFSDQVAVRNLLDGNFLTAFSNQEPGGLGYRGAAGAVRSRDVDGRDIVAYYSVIPGTQWGLVSEASWNGLLSVYQRYLIAQSLLFVLGVILPAIVVGYGIRWITEPIYKLMAAVEEVAQGKFGQQIRVRTGDELEELVDGFNQMSSQLSQSYEAIKEREERLALVMRGTNDGIWDWNIASGEVYFSPRWKSMLGYQEDEFAGQFEEWFSLVHPEEAGRVSQAIQDHLESGETLFQIEYRVRHKDGSYRWILGRATTLRDAQGQPGRMVGSDSDITQRKQAEEQLRTAYETLEQRVEERTRDLAILNAISALVSRSLELDEILCDALSKTLEIMNLEFGVAYRLEGERENEWISPEEAERLGPEQLFLHPLVYQGLSERFVRFSGRLPLTEKGVAAAMDRQAPLAWEVTTAPLDPEFKEVLTAEGIEQLVSIPLRVKGRLVGAIQLGARQVRSFTPDELHLLSAIGQQVGVAVENARLHETIQQTVALEERARLARELHDSVTQSLYSITLIAEAAARLLASGDQHTAGEHLRELRDTAQEALREMRLLIYELRPIAIEKSGLADALRLRLEAVESRSGIKTELHVDGVEKISYEVKAELYHVAQETLNNILKHAFAQHVRLILSYSDQYTCLEISDDGVGFEWEEAIRSGGLGLDGMLERAEKIGARLSVESTPGKGTRVRIEAPNRPDPEPRPSPWAAPGGSALSDKENRR